PALPSVSATPPTARLSVSVLAVTVRTPPGSLKIPPPLASPPGTPTAWLLDSVQRKTFKVLPALSIPAPCVDRPWTPADEDEESSLKGILGIVVVGKDTAAHARIGRADRDPQSGAANLAALAPTRGRIDHVVGANGLVEAVTGTAGEGVGCPRA